MDESDSRIQQIQCFNGHQARVNAVRISPKSGQIVISGSDDRRVQVWRLGKADPMLTLAGHPSAVDSVAIDHPEELVVVGCSSGTIKLWDLEQNKAIRTLTGHKAGIPAIEFHPFGDFFASGSADTTVKIWDVRRKSCIQTYIGQQDAITALKITPDGRWIATADNAGQIKIWDMTAGKLIKSFEMATCASGLAQRGEFSGVSSLAFNPADFVMAASDLSGAVSIYDLQAFELISSFARDSSITVANSQQLQQQQQPFVLSSGYSSTNAVSFDPEGLCVLQAASLGLDVWSTDDLSQQADTARARLGDVTEMRVNDELGQLYVASRDQHIVRLHSADLQNFNPYVSYTRDTDEVWDGVGSGQTRAEESVSSKVLSPNLTSAAAKADSFEDPPVSKAQQSAKSSHVGGLGRNQAYNANDSVKSGPLFKNFSAVPSGATLANTDEPIDFDIHPVMQASHANSNLLMQLAALSLKPNESKSELDLLNSISGHHRSFSAMLGSRLTHLRQIRSDWVALGIFSSSANGGVSSATGLPQSAVKNSATTDAQARMRKFLEKLANHHKLNGDSTAIVEVLRILSLRPRVLTLDAAGPLFELCASVLSRNVLDDHIIAISQIAGFLAKTFGDVVLDNLQQASFGLSGVNMTQEERINRCRAFQHGLRQLADAVNANLETLTSAKSERYSSKQTRLLQDLSLQIKPFIKV